MEVGTQVVTEHELTENSRSRARPHQGRVLDRKLSIHLDKQISFAGHSTLCVLGGKLANSTVSSDLRLIHKDMC